MKNEYNIKQVEVVELNNTNCKEYSEEEFMAEWARREEEAKKIEEETDQEEDFDFDLLFGSNEVEEVAPTFEYYIRDRKVSDIIAEIESKIKDAQKRLDKELAKAPVKDNNREVYTGIDEYEGDWRSIGYINKKRRINGINALRSSIEEYTESIEKMKRIIAIFEEDAKMKFEMGI